MKRYAASALLVFCSSVPFFMTGFQANVLPVATSYCAPYQTECRYGCCPYVNATCCSDGLQCCRGGETCIPDAGLCRRTLQEESDPLATSRATPVTLSASTDENSLPCPPCTTTCGENKCCSFRDATCCDDGMHCCPYHYECDITQGRCYMTAYNEMTSHMDGNNGTAVTKLFKSLNKLPYETCPGTDLLCPSYSSCCTDECGQWMCCLNPVHLEMDQGDICEVYPETGTE